MKHFTFMLFTILSFSMGIHGQTSFPGGVGNPEIWFKTVPVGDNLQGQYLWRDFGGDSVKLLLYDSRGVTNGNEYVVNRSQVRTYNFNPALDLGELKSGKLFVLEKSNLSQATIISVWGPDNTDFDKDMFLYLLNGSPGKGHIFTKDKIIHSTESGKGVFDYGNEEGMDLMYQATDEEEDISGFREKALKIAAYNRILEPNTSVWGEPGQATFSVGDIFQPSHPYNNSTFDTNGLVNRPFYGFTPEFIVYNRLLTPLERRKAETYLAVKYGITLEHSYISSDDALIWDMDENSGFKYRVTGYGRDDASGLHQKTSTTSYEEAPYFSDATGNLYDSFDLCNSYNLSSRYRLLVIGREPASMVQDGGFVLYGDNGEALATEEMEDVKGFRLMPRRWLLNTNIPPATGQEKLIEWDIQDLEVYMDGFKGKVAKPGTDAAAAGTLVTQKPLQGDDGYFSFVISSQRRGPVTVKFGTDNPQIMDGGNDYGYYIANTGAVYKVIRGSRQGASLNSILPNQRMEIVKESNTVYLRVEGTRNPAHDIQIEEADREKTYYGSIMIEKQGNDDIVLSEVCHGGFCDTGNRIELSYITGRADEFRDFRSGGKSFLVIDRSGTGDFSPGNIELISADEPDENRNKIIFKNIFWDTDGNGKDAFTFGYKLSGLMATATPSNPTCVNDSSLQDGSIDIKILQGTKGFTYNLKNAGTDETETGTFFTDSIRIENLPAGTYELAVSESGGFNFYPKQPGNHENKAFSLYNFNSSANAYMEWTIADEKQASAGMSFNASSQKKPAGMAISYGLQAGGGNLYPIDGGTTGTTPLNPVSPGDCIRVERTNNTIYYKLNGQVLMAVDIRDEDRSRYNYPLIEITDGGIYNLVSNTTQNIAAWVATENVAVEQPAGENFKETITLESGCHMEVQKTAPGIETQQTNEKEADGRLTVYYKDPGNKRLVTARIELPEPRAISLMVFDISGRLVHSTNMAKGLNITTADINLPGTGIYIIKAFTYDGEYTAKVISN